MAPREAGSKQDGLQEARQFCEVLTGNHLEEVLDPNLRQAKYFALGPQRLVVLLRKYRWARFLPLGKLRHYLVIKAHHKMLQLLLSMVIGNESSQLLGWDKSMIFMSCILATLCKFRGTDQP